MYCFASFAVKYIEQSYIEREFHEQRVRSNRRSICRYLILFIAVISGCAPQEVPETPKTSNAAKKAPAVLERETWSVCSILGNRVGYVQTEVYRDEQDGSPVMRTECLNQIEVKRIGQAVEMKIIFTSIEKPDGELLRFESIMKMGPQSICTTGRVGRQTPGDGNRHAGEIDARRFGLVARMRRLQRRRTVAAPQADAAGRAADAQGAAF